MLLLLMTGSAFKLCPPLQKQKQTKNRLYPPRPRLPRRPWYNSHTVHTSTHTSPLVSLRNVEVPQKRHFDVTKRTQLELVAEYNIHKLVQLHRQHISMS